MDRIADTINKIYQKYLPIVKKLGITLDIDFPDTTLTIRERERIERDLDKTMKSAVDRTRHGRILITVRPGVIIVRDDGTILSRAACKLLSHEHVEVKSRVGFGTTVTIRSASEKSSTKKND